MSLFGFLPWAQKKNETSATQPSKGLSLWRLLKEKLFGKKEIGEELIDTLEEALLQLDISAALADQIIRTLIPQLQQHTPTPELIRRLLQEAVTQLLAAIPPPIPLGATPSPFVILVVGVNGVGKTTTIGKLAAHYSQVGKKVLLGAADTFRAAAFSQLQTWALRAGADIVGGAAYKEPGAVAYQTLQQARARGAEVAIIDTAGRLHTKIPLMGELTKIKKVIGKQLAGAPHQVLLVIDGTTGQNGLRQAEAFHQAVGVTGLVISKLDGIATGGTLLNITTALRLPIMYVANGEEITDFHPFAIEPFVQALFAEG